MFQEDYVFQYLDFISKQHISRVLLPDTLGVLTPEKTSTYLNLIINAWETNQVLKPKSFVENISKFVPKYFNLDQQDSHECLMYILDYLHKALS